MRFLLENQNMLRIIHVIMFWVFVPGNVAKDVYTLVILNLIRGFRFIRYSELRFTSVELRGLIGRRQIIVSISIHKSPEFEYLKHPYSHNVFML